MDPIIAENKAEEDICNDMRHLGLPYKFDCKFIVGSDPNNTEIIYGCKYVFAIESPVFERMLLGDFKEAQTLTQGIALPDDDPQAVRHFRLLACTGDRASRMEALSLDDTLTLTLFCQKYMALSITKLCTDRLLSLCETGNRGDLIKMFGVTRLFVDTPLYENVIDKLEEYEYPIEETLNDLNQDAFKHYLFYLYSYSTRSCVSLFTAVNTYLEHNDLIPKSLLDDEETCAQKLNEINVDPLEKTGKANGDDPENADLEEQKIRRKYMRDLLKNINFADMNSTEFVAGPGASNILTFEQKYHILSCICGKLSPIKLFEM